MLNSDFTSRLMNLDEVPKEGTLYQDGTSVEARSSMIAEEMVTTAMKQLFGNKAAPEVSEPAPSDTPALT